MLLEIAGLVSRYGRIAALQGVDLVIGAGEIVALVGANGAGKTTLLKTISGVQPMSAGTIRFAGASIADLPPHRRVRLGIAQSPEGRQVFAPLTVADNLRLGAVTRRPADVKTAIDAVYDRFPTLAECRRQLAGTLSGGQQQMLAIGRALMADPKLLLLDEPSMGLAPRLIAAIFDIAKDLRRDGMTIFLVEQNARAALAIADRAYVIETGRIVLSGTGRELLVNSRVKEAYLGL